MGRPVSLEECTETLRLKRGMGFEESTLDEVGDNFVVMTFSDRTDASEEGEKGSQPAADARQTCAHRGCSRFEELQRLFDYVTEAYMGSPFPTHGEDGGSAYHDFFAQHDATLWTLDKISSTGEKALTPLTIDVVYTHVNPSSPSHTANLRTRGVLPGARSANRFRDWEELRYALRSFQWHAYRNGNRQRRRGAHPTGGVAAQRRVLESLGFTVREGDSGGVGLHFRFIYLVLADRDQLPVWLDVAAFPQLRVVTHAELFSPQEAREYLPLLNSLAIESVLHRIKGISRFFWYFNNDMLIGRRVSPFDLFRPLSPPRQALRFAALTGKNVAAFAERLGANESDAHALLLEPVLHAHSHFGSDVLVDTRPSAAFKGALGDAVLPACASASLERCGALRGDKLMAAQCLASGLALRLKDEKGRLSPLRSTPFLFSFKPSRDESDYLNNYALRLGMERLEGLMPTSTYSHIPLLVDRRILSFAMDGAGPDTFAAETVAVRKSHLRKANDFSPVHAYTPLALAIRRAREVQLWQRHRPPNKGTTPSHLSLSQDRFADPEAAVVVGQLCPLCGDSFSVQQQHPRLFAHLSAWAGLESDDDLIRSVFSLPTATERRRRQQLTQSAFPLPFTEEHAGKGIASSNHVALYADAFHHIGDGAVVRFVMLRDFVRLSISLALVKRFYAAGTPALFTTINDDLDEETAAMMTTPRHRAFLQDLLSASVGYVPRGPWEK